MKREQCAQNYKLKQHIEQLTHLGEQEAEQAAQRQHRGRGGDWALENKQNINRAIKTILL